MHLGAGARSELHFGAEGLHLVRTSRHISYVSGDGRLSSTDTMDRCAGYSRHDGPLYRLFPVHFGRMSSS